MTQNWNYKDLYKVGGWFGRGPILAVFWRLLAPEVQKRHSISRFSIKIKRISRAEIYSNFFRDTFTKNIYLVSYVNLEREREGGEGASRETENKGLNWLVQN